MRGLKLREVVFAPRKRHSAARSAPLMRGLKPGIQEGRVGHEVIAARSAPLMRGLKPGQAWLRCAWLLHCRAVCPANEGIETLRLCLNGGGGHGGLAARSAPLMRGLKHGSSAHLGTCAPSLPRGLPR